MFFHLNHWEEPFPCGLDPQKVRAAFSHLAPLETPHLLLRRVRRTDAPDLYRYGANPRVTGVRAVPAQSVPGGRTRQPCAGAQSGPLCHGDHRVQ